MSLVLDNPLTVLYNSIDLATVSGLTVLNRDVNQLPGKDVRVHKLARTDGSVTTTSQYTTKNLVISGVIIVPSRSEAETAIDSLRGLLASPEGTIDVMVAGKTRRYVGTLQTMSTAMKGGYVTFSLQFICSIIYGADTTQTTLLNAVAISASSSSPTIAVEGSYKAEPAISIVYSAITGGTAQTVNVYNSDDGIGISVTANFATGDILQIDNANKTVQLNSVDVARSGRFFSFLPGSRTITYSDTFSTRTAAMTVTYYRRYV